MSKLIPFFLLITLFGARAHSRLTTEPADFKVTVVNFDGQWVILQDKEGNQYRYPRDKFAAEKYKMHESFLIHKEGVLKYKIDEKKKKKKSKKEKKA